jgi:hypothetical protein
MADIKGTDWPRLLAETLAETDPDELGIKATDLETALFLRGQEVGKDGTSQEEYESMQDAIRQLLRIRIEKLGFPISHALFKRLQGME